MNTLIIREYSIKLSSNNLVLEEKTNMEKLKELLQKAGASAELSNEIVEAFDAYKAQLKNDADRLFEQRLQKAKEVCQQIVEEEKERLARKVAVFLESKARKIEEAAERHRKIEESEASAMLRQVEALVTGRDLNDGVGGDDRKLQAAKTTITRLQEQLANLSEERDLAIAKSNRAHKIAERALSRNHELESHLREGSDFIDKKKAEAAEKKGKKEEPEATETPVEESRKTPRKSKRLDESRKTSAKPKSTRKTLVESQTKPPRKQSRDSGIDPKIAELAKRIPEMPI